MKKYLLTFWLFTWRIFGLSVLLIGVLGVDHHFGVIWAILAAAAYKLKVHLIIAAYYGALDVLLWSSNIALLYTAILPLWFSFRVIVSSLPGANETYYTGTWDQLKHLLKRYRNKRHPQKDPASQSEGA
ncbi:hypothetical protein M0G74_01045 [Microbulbifer sp. CAU 1566]|uniref:hypothetical protein n=1 Tax=Microbulbifer sp. CAU 1566 TaxID=2933269 RepID=UPI002003495C|nr:hypothetical protein [Microbulbifer sp. CAU 1566]MCK7595850.1 hypothetical protein [Microbulbifer sp. CAU 1566]